MLHRIIRRLHATRHDALRERFGEWGENRISRCGLSLATKLEMLPLAARRVDERVVQLIEAVGDEDHVEQCVATKAAAVVHDHSLPFQLLLDVDAFIFESRSAYEIVGKFIREFFGHMLALQVSEQNVINMLQSKGIDTRWIDELKTSRARLFHEAAPWIALRRHQDQSNWQLLVLPDAGKDVESPETLDVGALQGIFSGFVSALAGIEAWLLERIDDLENQGSGAA